MVALLGVPLLSFSVFDLSKLSNMPRHDPAKIIDVTEFNGGASNTNSPAESNSAEMLNLSECLKKTYYCNPFKFHFSFPLI